jgi:hypothetical protein
LHSTEELCRHQPHCLKDRTGCINQAALTISSCDFIYLPSSANISAHHTFVTSPGSVYGTCKNIFGQQDPRPKRKAQSRLSRDEDEGQQQRDWQVYAWLTHWSAQISAVVIKCAFIFTCKIVNALGDESQMPDDKSVQHF